MTRRDAQENRDAILAAAARAFAKDANASLEGIAKAAGVGIGTLYRHFSTREVLFAAAYRVEIEALCAGTPALLRRYAPDVAIERFLLRVINHLEHRRGMVEAVRGLMMAGVARDHEMSAILAIVADALRPLVEAGHQKKVLRADVTVADLLLVKGAVAMARPETARRLAALLVDGLRHDAPRRSRPKR